ncbi:hypothetical protein GEV29_01760 [Aeromicrobium sp. SMF47]|uniref:Uncharacterized protein n=1 Tax=Aeromicrobium yanjiei TaxID=2662028 RepID=A0A5Q2MB09_9ACTN|nr:MULTISPECIES: hypothetical protein [Aeromicrobium]MRJ75254.1 hypothetical protein [Aeromicrobium yanjiei]MRK02688.1 hypothetical protein [Aeromicrobium sp. S22]QGG40284.1 hypothetical protein GEV26_02245 [Aeromicrobium yanjiei]
MTTTPQDPRDDVEPSDPIERHEPDLDPGLAPDPQHEVRQSPPEDAPGS